MPTSVGPNTKGEENLVFGYDLGDVSNSYRGEPTVNIIAGGNNRALGGSLPVGNRNFAGITVVETQNYFYSKDRPDVVRLVCTATGSNGYKEFAQQSTGNTSGNTYIYSFDYKFVVPNDSGTGDMGTPFVYGNGYKNPDSGTRQANVSQTDYPLKDGWTRRVFKYDATYTGNNYYRTNVVANGRFFEVLLDNFQIQENTHVTPFTADTRSATQGLIDVTGNSTIDLSNVSFDLNALPDWDGTSDYIKSTTPSDFRMGTSSFTLEAVAKQDVNTGHVLLEARGNNLIGYLWVVNHGTTGRMSLFYNDDSNQNIHYQTGDFNVTLTGVYYHLAVKVDRNENNIYFYINGEQAGNAVALQHTNSISPSSSDYYHVGWDRGGSPWNGQIAMFKHYNRVLTASEIRANYNALKGRFNI